MVARMALEGGRQRRARLPLGQVGGHHLDRPARCRLAQPCRLLFGVPSPGAIKIRVNGDVIDVAGFGGLAASRRGEQPHLTRPGPGQRIAGPSLAAPADDPADRAEFTLDADAWEEWGSWCASATRKPRESRPGAAGEPTAAEAPKPAAAGAAAAAAGTPACTRPWATAPGSPTSRPSTTRPRLPPAGFWRRAQDRFWVDDMPVDAAMTDNGADFCSGLLSELPARRRVAHLRTRAYRPQTNGKAQRRLSGRRGRAET